MSRAYEALLKNEVQRLDRLIAVTESVGSKSDDPVTLQQIEFDLDRWRESRARFATLLVRTKRWNRIISVTLGTFAISFGVLLLFALFGEPTNVVAILLLGLDLLILLASGVVFLIVITLRDAIARGREPWRFSLRSVLIVMTAIALALGALVWIARH